MNNSVWNSYRESVCSLNYYNHRNILFFRSSGFRYDDFIISVLCEKEIERSAYVIISFEKNEPGGGTSTLRIPVIEFCSRFPRDIEKSLPGILVLPVRPDELISVPAVKRHGCLPEAGIGALVAMLSYSLDISQLYMKIGNISSHLTIRDEVFIFVQLSVEHGNSGSPLINACSGDVLGVMVDGFLSSRTNHEKLKHIINENISMLNELKGRWTLGNVDPVQVLIANQHMINYLAREIYLSFQRNFGFAVPMEKITGFLRKIKRNSKLIVSDKAEI